jgi:tetratricopeptide (TPR) repeat protein
MEAMIPVKYDSEKGAGIEISKKYRVGAWPTIMLLDSDGKEIDRIVGFVEPEKFIEVIGDYQNGIGTVADFEARVKKNPGDAEAWKALGTKYADAIRGQEANDAFTKYLQLTPEISGEEKAEAFYSIGEAYYVDKSYEEAAKIFAGVIEEFPESEWRDAATTRLARAYYGLGRIEECVTIYKAYADRHPDDPRACNSFAWFCATKKVGLDAALPVALRAVELTERDPGYLDTLAELYYAREEFDEAIEIGQEAADKDPEDQYLKDQLSKFKKAKDEAGKRASK